MAQNNFHASGHGLPQRNKEVKQMSTFEIVQTSCFGDTVLKVKDGQREFSLCSDGELIIFTDTASGEEQELRPIVSSGEDLLKELARFLGYKVSK